MSYASAGSGVVLSRMKRRAFQRARNSLIASGDALA